MDIINVLYNLKTFNDVINTGVPYFIYYSVLAINEVRRSYTREEKNPKIIIISNDDDEDYVIIS